MSTETESTGPAAVVTVQSHDVLRLAQGVSLRPERFGALAYSFETRKLSFLKHPELVRVVESMDGRRSVDQVLDHIGVAPERRRSFLRALATLESSQMLVRAEVPGAA